MPSGSLNSNTGPPHTYTTPRPRTGQHHPRWTFWFSGMASGECWLRYGLQRVQRAGCTGRQAIGHSGQHRRPWAASSHLPHHIGASKKEPRPPRLTAPPTPVSSMPFLLALPLVGGGASPSATRCHPASGPAVRAIRLILSALCSLCPLCFQIIPFNSGPLFFLKLRIHRRGWKLFDREGFVPA